MRPFIKMHGLGNDFVIIDGRKDGFVPDEAFCLNVADRHRGVGYDQLIVLLPASQPDYDLQMRIYNADGSLTGACGNGTRCVARLFFEETCRSEGLFETSGGILKVGNPAPDIYSVDFGEPRLNWDQIPLAKEMDTLHVDFGIEGLPDGCCVNVGNPHTLFFVPDVMAIALEKIGPVLEHHPLFPQRCNIEFAQILDRGHIRMRVWERGTGITQACGSGSLATLIAAVRRGLTDRKATIHLDGGDLYIEWRESDNHVTLAGAAAKVFRGELCPEFLA
ncbi:MAG: diaminopimelate epimerase [Proteobacteria bacterium]|jgi:diaminopimelate epimerase|nr:diaminopimelate epimerase [Alphaproteobacteria bacterium]NCC03537.1 diaminopimelate epimerase [Pseudomonadota bacterium]